MNFRFVPFFHSWFAIVVLTSSGLFRLHSLAKCFRFLTSVVKVFSLCPFFFAFNASFKMLFRIWLFRGESGAFSSVYRVGSVEPAPAASYLKRMI